MGIPVILYILVLSLCQRSYHHVIIKQRGQSIIRTRYGHVRGVLVEIPVKPPAPSLRNVEAYLGLQFGFLRSDILRFMAPKGPVDTWRDVRYADNYSEPCPQKKFNRKELRKFLPNGTIEHIHRVSQFINSTSEECLHLNVYVPTKPKSQSKYHYLILEYIQCTRRMFN